MTLTNKQIVAGAIAFVSLCLLFVIYNYEREKEAASGEQLTELKSMLSNQSLSEQQDQGETTKPEKNDALVVIDVKGAVKKPGVYELKQGDRVKDAINLAGGFLTEANTTEVNLAQKLQDEMVVYVPKAGEQGQFYQTDFGKNEQVKLININQASGEELQLLPGIGPSKAEAIIAYREENGLFQKIEDLLNVSGIGQGSFDKLKDSITVQ